MFSREAVLVLVLVLLLSPEYVVRRGAARDAGACGCGVASSDYSILFFEVFPKCPLRLDKEGQYLASPD